MTAAVRALDYISGLDQVMQDVKHSVMLQKKVNLSSERVSWGEWKAYACALLLVDCH